MNTILSIVRSSLRRPQNYGPVRHMRLVLLTILTMIAFAANSVLNRMAVDSGGIDPHGFAVVRVLSGAVVLTILVLVQRRALPLRTWRRVIGGGTLTLYMIGFSTAYLTLDAGLGALILFGVVQITMFVAAAMTGTAVSRRQIVGAGIAFSGLVWVLWPTERWAVDGVGAVFMVAAGTGWAFYTLAGRGEPDALAATAANFCVALPLTVLAAVLVGGPFKATSFGLGLAVMSGTVTSGLGYALWYSIVPRLAPPVAATVQLSVPVIALAGGLVFLGEGASLRFLTGAALVIGGIALSSTKRASR